MIIVILFLFFIALLFAWFNKAKPAKIVLIISLIASIALFAHHVTTHLTIQL